MGMDELKDVKELKEVMKVISETVPELLNRITKVLYDAQEGEKMGQAVAAFYSELVKSGMTSEQAYALTREYMSSMSIGSMISGVLGGSKEKDDLAGIIKEKVRDEIERELNED